jgi:peptide/nickel transport system permease protein
MVLPLVTLSLPFIAEYYKYLRDNIEEVMSMPFIENLRANGLSENKIMWKHVMPNAISPLISIAGVEFGLLFSGALIVEVIFALPGMGRLTVEAIFSRDYPLIVGCTFFSGLLILFTNLVADVVKALIDKRLLKGI